MGRVAAGDSSPADRAAGSGHPLPAPTERSVRISRTTLYIIGTLTPIDPAARLCHSSRQQGAHPGDPRCPTPARPWSAWMPRAGTT